MVHYMPLWLYLLDSLIFTALLVFLFFTLIIKRGLQKKVRLLLDTNGAEQYGSPPVISNRVLLFYSDYVEKLSRVYGRNLPLLTGLDELWLEKLRLRPGRKNMLRLLTYVPEKSLFDVLQAALAKTSLQKDFVRWMKTSGELMILKKIALSGKGRPFNGKKAAVFFRDDMETLVEMASDPLWQCRFFAISILVHDSSRTGDHILRKGFQDSHSRIRTTLIDTYQSDDRDFLYGQLRECFLDDPVFEVREHAKTRINREFQDLYAVVPEELSLLQKLHLVELLHTESAHDENIGISFLTSGSRELELYAARYLSKTGTLSRLLKTADPGDRENFNRSYTLLNTAVRAHCTDFLKEITQTDAPGPLLLASRFLQNDGTRLLITPLLEKAAALYRQNPPSPVLKELYANALTSACRRGNDKVLLTLGQELVRQKYSQEIQALLLPELPLRGDTIFIPVIIDFLKDPKYPAGETLYRTLIRFSSSSVIPQMLSIIQSSPETVATAIKKRALLVLGKMENGCCMQHILENLPILSLAEAKAFTLVCIRETEELFDTRALLLLSSHDAAVRSRLIATLPADHLKQFIPALVTSLQDSDPEVRAACVWAFSRYGDTALLKKCAFLLQDPVERVRKETARALCLSSGGLGLTMIKKTLFDKTSSLPVKEAIISGLGEAGTPEAFTILTGALTDTCELPEGMEAALANFDTEPQIRQMFKLVDTVPPASRPILRRVLNNLGTKAEKTAVEILHTRDSLLRNHAVDVLESSGFVDRTVRRLGHRDPAERLRAAEMLSLLGTKKAYRGLMGAAKDPVEKIRIEVIKAVDRLDAPEGRTLLEELKNDPDRKVRRYTLWALERAEAKEL